MKKLISVVMAACLLNANLAFAFTMSPEMADSIIKKEMLKMEQEISAQPEADRREYAIDIDFFTHHPRVLE